MNEQKPQGNHTEGKYMFGAFPLYEHKTPEFRETQGYQYVRYGDDNSYPDYLIYLYNRSAVHNAIVNGKTRFIQGRGWQIKDGQIDPNLSQFLKRINPIDSINELSYKCILDRLIFGGYALRVVWLGGKIVNVYHQPFQEIRTDVEQTEYYISKEWTRLQSTKAKFKASQKMPEDVRIIAPFDPNVRTGEQLLYICDYRPQQNIYPLPEYIPANAAVETDIEIDNFHLNNIKSGFAAGMMVTLYNGKPSEDEAARVERDLKAKFTGTDNAGEVVLNFAEVNETPPTVTPLRSNELDKQYEQLAKATIEKIFVGHQVTAPQLFGLKTESGLSDGWANMDIAWKLLQLNYVEPRQEQFESDFNYLLGFTGYNGQIEIKPLKPLGMQLSEATIAANLDRAELRQLIEEQMGIELKDEVQAPAPVQMDKQKVDFDSILINKFSQIGVSKDEFEFIADALTEDEKKLIDYLAEKKTADLKAASKELKINAEKIFKKLVEKNIIQAVYTTETRVEIKDITPPPVEDKVDVLTMWEYAWVNPDLADDVENSRDFCRRLLGLNKLYTREEIDNLNNEMKDFNTDVWLYRGGWYTVPNTEGLLRQPSCRHYWKSLLVKRKNGQIIR